MRPCRPWQAEANAPTCWRLGRHPKTWQAIIGIMSYISGNQCRWDERPTSDSLSLARCRACDTNLKHASRNGTVHLICNAIPNGIGSCGAFLVHAASQYSDKSQNHGDSHELGPDLAPGSTFHAHYTPRSTLTRPTMSRHHSITVTCATLSCSGAVPNL